MLNSRKRSGLCIINHGRRRSQVWRNDGRNTSPRGCTAVCAGLFTGAQARKRRTVRQFSPDANKLGELILKPAGFDGPAKEDVRDMWSTRAKVAHAWKLAKKAYGDAEKDGAEDVSAGTTCLEGEKRLRILPGYRGNTTLRFLWRTHHVEGHLP